MQQEIICGRLVGLSNDYIEIDEGSGQMRVYPRQRLNISLQWASANIEKLAICIAEDGIVTKVDTFG